MNKSFLKTFVVLIFLSVYFLNGNNFITTTKVYALETAYAQSTESGGFLNSLQSAGGAITGWMTGATQVNWLVNKWNGTDKTITQNLLSPVGDALKSVLMSIIQSMGVMFLKLADFILVMSGEIFDKVLEYTVKTSVLYSALKDPISNSWKIIRDLANIAIVFSLLYLAIRTILNGNGFADTKTLAGVLAAALLINFSLLFTQIVFTTSNFVSKSIVEQITFNGGADVSISGNIARLIGTKDVVNKLWNAQGLNAGFDTAFSDLQAGVLAGLTTLVVAAILIIAALMMIYRFLIFTFLMITSPIGLVSSFIPWFKGTGAAWWGQLKQQFLFLPVFMITLYVALLFIGTITKGMNSNIGFPQFLFLFILTCGFLLAVLIIPSKVAGGGANMMTNFGEWGKTKLRALPKRSVQLAGQAAASGTARTGRYVGGKLLANKILNDDRLKAAATSDGKWGSVARTLLRQGESLKGKTFDVRNTKYGKNLGIGEGITNWNDAVAAKQKKLEDRKKKESKIFGFDKMSEDNKEEIAMKEADRDIHAEDLKQKEQTFKAKRSTYLKAQNDYNKEQDATIKATMKVAMEKALEAQQKALVSQQKARKDLEKAELEVGQAKNKGDVEYMKLVKARNERMWNRLSLSEKAAIEKMQKELDKKWKEDGKAKKQKDKGGSSSHSIVISASSAAGSSPVVAPTRGSGTP